MPNLCEGEFFVAFCWDRGLNVLLCARSDLEYLDERYRLRVFTWSAGRFAWLIFCLKVAD